MSTSYSSTLVCRLPASAGATVSPTSSRLVDAASACNAGHGDQRFVPATTLVVGHGGVQERVRPGMVVADRCEQGCVREHPGTQRVIGGGRPGEDSIDPVGGLHPQAHARPEPNVAELADLESIERNSRQPCSITLTGPAGTTPQRLRARQSATGSRCHASSATPTGAGPT